MSERPNPVTWVLRQHLWLLAFSVLIMVAAPYLGSLPVRTIPAVVALATPPPEVEGVEAADQAASSRASSGELDFFLGSHADDLTFVLLLLVIAGALSFGLALVNTRVAARLSSLANRDLRLQLHETLLTRPPSYLREAGRADMVRTALINQSRVVAGYATNTLPSAIGVFFAVAIWAQTLFTAVDSPGRRGTAVLVVGGVVVLLLTVNLVAVWISGTKSQQSQGEVMKEQGAFIGLAGESVSNLTSLQLNVAEKAHQERVRQVLDRMSKAEVRVASWSALATAASGGVVLLGIPLLVLVWKGLGLGGGHLAVMIPALLMLQRSVSSVGSLWTMRKVALPAIDLISDLLVEEPSITSGAGDEVLDSVEGRLFFDDVHWKVEGREVLRGVSLDVEPGQIVALVGTGGCGKSTLLRLALRVIDPDSGSVSLDGKDVRDLRLDELRQRIGVLEQHPAFFARTLRENLLLDGREVDDAAIHKAADIARFTEVMNRLQGGLEHHLAGASGTLSGSERRRLALTRLLLRDPDVIFIDELEAGLPQADAQALLRDVRDATAGKTCLMVTHRPDLLEADRVAFVHEGCILKIGTHEELERDCAQYRSLLAEQREEDES
jgi:ABC-type multidrug transport system fused ATPase/permease subunit